MFTGTFFLLFMALLSHPPFPNTLYSSNFHYCWRNNFRLPKGQVGFLETLSSWTSYFFGGEACVSKGKVSLDHSPHDLPIGRQSNNLTVPVGLDAILLQRATLLNALCMIARPLTFADFLLFFDATSIAAECERMWVFVVFAVGYVAPCIYL